ncbi:MAG: bifunctional homocysteine S-methyltransferase/methylenetetrahydrofolate reductase [Calditrichaeota bacterium]|nr:bifunctional homocysteine S-methyltransferase/methylenetetrahydrofolate reductase [Calditrichota bacterium]
MERLRSEVMIVDGAIGTSLYTHGFSYRACFDELNETHPEVVEDLHRDYIAAGAQIIETNTFGANSFKLGDHGFAEKTRLLNRLGAQIAKRAAGEAIYVAGSIGPLDRVLEPIGPVTLQQAHDAFREQVTGLLEGGVDLFIVETISNLFEMREAIAAIRELSDLPIVATMTFTEDGKTLVGDKPAQVRRALIEYGADVVGANCSIGPQPMLDVMERMGGSEVPLCAQPNAGSARVIGGRHLFLASPQYFADYAVKFADAGVALIGGCCGTTPDHVRAMALAVKGRAPGKSHVQVNGEISEEEGRIEGPHRGLPFSDFRENLGKRFQISVEIDPPRSYDPGPFIRHAQRLKAAGVDLINVADSPLARARMSAVAMAHLIRRDAGVDVLLHVSCRDRNAIGLQSELLGAHTLGVLNILAVTGDPTNVGDYPFAKGVFELDSIGLSRMVTQLNRGKDLTGRDLDDPTHFLLGVAVNPTSPKLDLEYDRFKQKLDAGAQFAFTQPLFDPRTLDEFMNRISSFTNIPIFVGIMPLRSSKHAEFIHNEIPDMFVPQDIRTRMSGAGTEGAKVGVEISQKFLLDTQEMVQGAYLMPPFNKFDMAIDVMKVLSREPASS